MEGRLENVAAIPQINKYLEVKENLLSNERPEICVCLVLCLCLILMVMFSAPSELDPMLGTEVLIVNVSRLIPCYTLLFRYGGCPVVHNLDVKTTELSFFGKYSFTFSLSYY